MGELIAVLSGKGGTGKTSVCAGLACALAEMGQTVLCIDCDVGLRNLDISLGMTQAGALSFLDVMDGGYALTQAARHPDYETLQFLTAPVSCSPAGIDSGRFAELLEKARAGFSYVFLDAPAGIDIGFRLAAQYADRILLVTGPDPAAVRDAQRSGTELELMEKTAVRLIVNRIDRKTVRAMHLTVDDIMDAAGLPLIGIVPEDRNVTLSAARGRPLLKKARSSAAGACRRIANRLIGRSVPITL